MEEEVNYYCFNKRCINSIFHPATCVVFKIALSDALNNDYCCTLCDKLLISRQIIEIDRELDNLLSAGKTYKCIIIDDDPDYHIGAKALFETSFKFDESTHLTNAIDALDFLTNNKNKPSLIPDCIFLDVNMPGMDAWGFLEEFESLSPALSKKVDIYVITSDIHPNYRDRIKAYPYVKGLVSKNFDLSFLNSIN